MTKNKKGLKPKSPSQNNKKEDSKKNAMLISLIIALFAAWIPIGYNIFTINFVDIKKERETHQNLIRDRLPFWDKIDKECGNFVFNLDKSRVSEKQKHDFFMAHYMDILACADSMVNITIKMKPFLRDDEFREVLNNSAKIVIYKQSFINIYNPYKDNAEDIANDIKMAYKKFLFSNKLEEKNVIGNNENLAQIDEVALRIYDCCKLTQELEDSCKKHFNKYSDYYNMSLSDFFPAIIDYMKKENKIKELEIFEHAYDYGIITPMIENWKIVNGMNQPYYPNHFKIPYTDLYISYNFVWQIILSILFYYICGSGIWHFLKRVVEKSSK